MNSEQSARELQSLRTVIDEVDEEIISLLAKRFVATHQVGLLKAQARMAATDIAREDAQKARYAQLASLHGLNESLIQSIFSTIVTEVVSSHISLAKKV